MSCLHCGDTPLTAEQLKNANREQLIKNVKIEGKEWAKKKGFTGTLYVVEFVNGFRHKTIENLNGREYEEAFYVSG